MEECMKALLIAILACVVSPVAATAQNVALVVLHDAYDRMPDVGAANSAQAAAQ